MKSVYITQFGEIENLAIRDVPDPVQPRGRNVLIRVRAAGLNRADLLQVRGVYPPPAGYSPNIPGLEFAGEVAAIGEDAGRWKIGDRVFGITAGDAQAEFVLSDTNLLLEIPDNLSFTEAACVPEAFITAHDAVFTLGDLKAGEKLLIHAVGSGVGLAALQMAKARDAFVIGTSRTADKLDRSAQMGLDFGILTDAGPSFAQKVMEITTDIGADVILDLVGAVYFGENLASLANKGRLVLVGLTSGATAEFDLRVALRKRARISGTVLRARSIEEKAEATHKFADEFFSLFEDGKIGPNLDRVFEFDDVIAAYKFVEANKNFGKVVLEF